MLDLNTAPIRVLDYTALDDFEKRRLSLRAEDDLSPFIEKVIPIIEAVKQKGDDALIEFAAKFDQAKLSKSSLKASPLEFDEAFKSLSPEMIETLEFSAQNIRHFHQAQMPQEIWMKEIRSGVFAGERTTPIDSVALYSPRGKGSFPSVTLMTAIPAVVAGVKRAIILTPPGADGKIDPATLVAAKIAGIDEVYKVGGAQAVAAAAFGTNQIPACLKIEGPGSPYFMAAKHYLRDKIDVGLPAGPSEVIIFADDSAIPEIVALDLIIESEHGEDSSAYLVTTSSKLANAVCRIIPEYWQKISLQRAKYSHAVLSGKSGGILIMPTTESCFDFINDYAPEHLQILSLNPLNYLTSIRNAGEILLGHYTPGSVANYMMGPNCVLPTSFAAKTRSALSVQDFLKRSSIGHITPEGLNQLAEHTHRFATYEGFDAHALAVSELRWQILGKK